MIVKTGVLLVNLGTPASPERRDVYRYLIEFLTDGRVIDTPPLWRNLLVRGLIVPRRYKASAKNYRAIWTPNGSPLLVYGRQVARKLQEELGSEYRVALAMRYQRPSIHHALELLQRENLEELIILPLFPQYASATTGSIHQKVMEELRKWPVIPKTRFVNSYPTQPKMIATIAKLARRYPIADYDHVLFSFHGLPERHLKKADCGNWCLKREDCCKRLGAKNHHCYGAQCTATATAIAKELGLAKEEYTICYQSRLGRSPWIKPYLSEVIANRRKGGDRRLLVFSPAFVADCLETIHEIGIEYRDEFLNAGGDELTLVPSLNAEPEWIEALAEIVQGNAVTEPIPDGAIDPLLSK